MLHEGRKEYYITPATPATLKGDIKINSLSFFPSFLDTLDNKNV